MATEKPQKVKAVNIITVVSINLFYIKSKGVLKDEKSKKKNSLEQKFKREFCGCTFVSKIAPFPYKWSVGVILRL